MTSSLFHAAQRSLPVLWPAHPTLRAQRDAPAPPATTTTTTTASPRHGKRARDAAPVLPSAKRRPQSEPTPEPTPTPTPTPQPTAPAAAAPAPPPPPGHAATKHAGKPKGGASTPPVANWLALKQTLLAAEKDAAPASPAEKATEKTEKATDKVQLKNKQTKRRPGTASSPSATSASTSGDAGSPPGKAAKASKPRVVLSLPKSKAATSKPEVWFDDVPADVIARAHLPSAVSDLPVLMAPMEPQQRGGRSAAANANVAAILEGARKERVYVDSSDVNVGRYVAMDCEMVGVGPDGSESVVARVSLVNFHGHELLDAYVIPREQVTDYRTKWSGIRPANLKAANGARPMSDVVKEVAEIIKDRILVGHALDNDLKALMLKHPASLTRDTAYYKPFRVMNGNRTPSLKTLALKLLGLEIQSGEHSSVEDARTTMLVYRKVKRAWDAALPASRRQPNTENKKPTGKPAV